MNCCGNVPGSNSNSLATPVPNFIPAYLGYLPPEKYGPGHTYGLTSHRVLDSCNHTCQRPQLIRPEHCTDSYGRSGLGEDPFMQSHMALVNSRGDSFGRQQYQYQPNMTLPGCPGSVIPRFQSLLGHTYTPACNRAWTRCEQAQHRERIFNKELQSLDAWRICNKAKPWESLEDNVRPNAKDPQACDCCDPCKGNMATVQSRLRSALLSPALPSKDRCSACAGGSGSDSWGRQHAAGDECCCGPSTPFSILSKDHPKCDYGERRMWGLTTDKLLNIPCGFSNNIRINSHKFCKPLDRVQEIYRGCEGMIPSYAGHVPGEDFRMGKTFGTSTRNAKRALDETFHAPLCMPVRFD